MTLSERYTIFRYRLWRARRKLPLVLIPVGIIYILETLSDIIQVGYFKLTHGKRIFKMAPLHHHFEMCGWKETKVVAVFTAVSTVFCVIAFFAVRYRFTF